MNHSFPGITVLWLDHHASATNDPLSLEDVAKLCRPQERETRGYLVYESKQCLAIANTIEEDGSVTEVDFIIKRAIKKRMDEETQ